MDFYTNELSLHAQFDSKRSFIESLKTFLKCRNIINEFGYRLYASRAIVKAKVTQESTFIGVINGTRDHDLIRHVIGLFSINGPFWEDFRIHCGDDIYECNGEVVTDSSLAEAAFRLSDGYMTAVISFYPSRYDLTPLTISWTDSFNQAIPINIDNYWVFEEINNLLSRIFLVDSWPSLLRWTHLNCSNLIFADYLQESLNGVPFSRVVAHDVQRLLKILDTYKRLLDDHGNMDSRKKALEIINTYFHGKRAKFSDESYSNKNEFKRALTFKHPRESGDIFCPFHGKINQLVFRIHFNWPITPGENLYIVYIGPKRTKD